MSLISAENDLTIPIQDSNCHLEARVTLILGRIRVNMKAQPCSLHDIYVPRESEHTYNELID
jgi:hypothetical protein